VVGGSSLGHVKSPMSLAGLPPPVPPALHPDRIVVDQPGRAVVRLLDRSNDPPRVHKSVQALEAGIRDWNTHPRPFAWTKTADEILDPLAKYLARISGAAYWPRSASRAFGPI
jgi:hypothetical protein